MGPAKEPISDARGVRSLGCTSAGTSLGLNKVKKYERWGSFPLGHPTNGLLKKSIGKRPMLEVDFEENNREPINIDNVISKSNLIIESTCLSHHLLNGKDMEINGGDQGDASSRACENNISRNVGESLISPLKKLKEP